MHTTAHGTVEIVLSGLLIGALAITGCTGTTAERESVRQDVAAETQDKDEPSLQRKWRVASSQL